MSTTEIVTEELLKARRKAPLRVAQCCLMLLNKFLLWHRDPEHRDRGPYPILKIFILDEGKDENTFTANHLGDFVVFP